MKIAIAGTLDKPIRGDSLGGTEIWTYNFINELSNRGVEVTLFALEGSETSGELVPICSFNDISNKETGNMVREKYSLFNAEAAAEIANRSDQFDLIHFSVFPFYYYLPVAQRIQKPTVFTIHGYNNMTASDIAKIFDRYDKPNYVFPSRHFSIVWPAPKKETYIAHGIRLSDFPLKEQNGGEYFLWLGRLMESKGVVDALEFAKRSGERLVLAGPVDNQQYFDEKIKPYIGDNVEYVGPVNFEQKTELYKKAKALIFTSKVCEAFGLTITESLASGTPVIAYNNGPSAEIIEDKKSGFLVQYESIEELMLASRKVEQIDRYICRERVEAEFSINHMVDRYLSLYEKIKNNE